LPSFLDDTLVHLVMLRQQQVSPRKRQRRRFVAGKEHRHDLVPQLSVRHTLAGFLVAGGQQHR
jgi:hypothetical protein